VQMKPEHIKEVQVKRPFKPFRLRLADGTFHVIAHPELLWVTDTLVGIASAVSDPHKDVPSKAVLCDPAHVVAIEFLPRHSKAA
jgi:hypothetical protein